MFTEMRATLSIPKTTDILEHIYSLPASEQPAAQESIRAIERRAMADQQPQPGLVQLMTYLNSRGVRRGICTRNFDAPVEHLLGKFLKGQTIGPVVTREFRPAKPSPEGEWFSWFCFEIVRVLWGFWGLVGWWEWCLLARWAMFLWRGMVIEVKEKTKLTERQASCTFQGSGATLMEETALSWSVTRSMI